LLIILFKNEENVHTRKNKWNWLSLFKKGKLKE